MTTPDIVGRMEDYLRRQSDCLDGLTARLDAGADGNLDWEGWSKVAGADLGMIVQLSEEFALLVPEWESADGVEQDDRARVNALTGAVHRRAGELADRYFRMVTEAQAELERIGAELEQVSRGRTMLRNYRGPQGPNPSQLDTQA